MDGRVIAAEHMGTSYLWRSRKSGHRVHIENPETARAYCQVEHCRHGEPLDGRGAEVPTGRRLCGNCVDLAERDRADYREPDVRVLMGERLAEEGDDKWGVNAPFRGARIVAPKPWKRKKQARPAHRSRSRKPKRSTVKHLRPFNDDLPW